MAMDQEQRQALKQALIQERDDLTALSLDHKSDRAPVELDQQSVGRLSRMDAMQQQSMDMAREERRRHRRDVIAAALARIEDDDYGYCLVCGEDIPSERYKFTKLSCVHYIINLCGMYFLQIAMLLECCYFT